MKPSRYFIIGLVAGVLLTLAGGVWKKGFLLKCYARLDKVIKENPISLYLPRFIPEKFVEDFSSAVEVENKGRFGEDGFLTFELFRGGTFVIPGNGVAEQRSDSYRDVALIRSTKPLGRTYKVSAVVGHIDYGLENIDGLPKDPEYPEGPPNENGCYLLAITDVEPSGHHLNAWWHRHRKVVIDVDNNVWGNGMPNPVFMAYFDRDNNLHALDGTTGEWTEEWSAALHYKLREWYRVEIEKTTREFILSVYTENGDLIKRGNVPLKEVMNGKSHQDYLIIGDPHENYYQGSMMIKSIVVER